jgi:hypothetical protein
MPNQAISPAAGLTADQIDRILNQMADSFGQQLRSPIWHSPSDASLDYEDVTFPSLDGVPLEGWFIPAPGSNKIIIANHPMGFSRSGIPAHLEPWRSVREPERKMANGLAPTDLREGSGGPRRSFKDSDSRPHSPGEVPRGL